MKIIVLFTVFSIVCYVNISAQELVIRHNDSTANYIMVEPQASFYNTFYGQDAGNKTTDVCCNTFIGGEAGQSNIAGEGNTVIGTGAGQYNISGAYNTYIGRFSGRNNKGTGNVFLGYQSGWSELGNNKLYIHNSSSGNDNALIYGEFDNGKLRINNELGIGTAAANYPLSIKGDAQEDLLQFKDNLDVGQWHLKFSGSNNLNFVESDVAENRLVLKEGGNIGIGTPNPGAHLHIASDTSSLLVIEADWLNTNEASNPMLEFRQDGGQTSTFVGFNEAEFGSNNFGISTNNSTNSFVISTTGAVAIGTNDFAAGHKLSVNGKVATEEVRVQLQAEWPDYVFKDNYKLMSISELEKSIKDNQHLPGIPSAKQLESEGLQLGEMQTLTMEKIEELTLYIIELNKKVENLAIENKALKVALEAINAKE